MTPWLVAIKYINDIYKLFINIFESGWTGKLLLITLYFFPLFIIWYLINKIKINIDEKCEEFKKKMLEFKPCTGECLNGVLKGLETLRASLYDNLKNLPHDTDLRDVTENIKMLSSIVDTMKAILISWGGKK